MRLLEATLLVCTPSGIRYRHGASPSSVAIGCRHWVSSLCVSLVVVALVGCGADCCGFRGTVSFGFVVETFPLPSALSAPPHPRYPRPLSPRSLYPRSRYLRALYPRSRHLRALYRVCLVGRWRARCARLAVWRPAYVCGVTSSHHTWVVPLPGSQHSSVQVSVPCGPRPTVDRLQSTVERTEVTTGYRVSEQTQ